MPWYIYIIIPFVLFIVWFVVACRRATIIDGGDLEGMSIKEAKIYYDASR